MSPYPRNVGDRQPLLPSNSVIIYGVTAALAGYAIWRLIRICQRRRRRHGRLSYSRLPPTPRIPVSEKIKILTEYPRIHSPGIPELPASPIQSLPEWSEEDINNFNPYKSFFDLHPTPTHLASGAITSGDLVRLLQLPASTVRRHTLSTLDADGLPTLDEADEAEPSRDISDAERGIESEMSFVPRPARNRVASEQTADGVEVERKDLFAAAAGGNKRRHMRIYSTGSGGSGSGGIDRTATW